MEFTVQFQIRVLVLLYINKNFYLENKKYVKPEHFSSLFLQWAFNLLDEYFNKYKELPTRTVVEEELFKAKNIAILEEEENILQDFLSLLAAGFIQDESYIVEKFENWVRSCSIKEVLANSDGYIDKGDFDSLTINLRTKAKEFNNKALNPEETFSLLNLEEIYKNRVGIKTGIGIVDNIIGGCQKKELSLLLADTNTGKSLLLTYMMGNAIRDLHHVLHVTLEMSRPRTLIRYYTTLADPEDKITYGNIYNFTPEEEVYSYMDKLHEKYEKYLRVVEVPSGKCTIEDLYRLMDKYPDTEILALDYMDLMKAPLLRREKRHESEDIVTSLRGLAAEANIHIMSPTQTNKLAANKRIVDKHYVAEDYNKMRIADWSIAIGQGKTDIDKHEAVCSIPRSRNSEKGFAERYYIDFNTMKFVFLSQEVINDN